MGTLTAHDQPTSKGGNMSVHTTTAVKVWPSDHERADERADRERREVDALRASNDERADRILYANDIAPRLPERWDADARDLLVTLATDPASVSNVDAGVDRGAPHPDALSAAPNGERQTRLRDAGSGSRSSRVRVTRCAWHPPGTCQDATCAARTVVRWETAMGRTLAPWRDETDRSGDATVPTVDRETPSLAALAESADRGW